MKPYGNKPETTFPSIGADFAMDKDKGLYVAFIWEGSEADSKGLSVGDKILSINGTYSQAAVYTKDKEILILHLLDKEETLTLEVSNKDNFY